MKIFLCSTAYDLQDFRPFVVHELAARGHEVLYHESPTFPAKLDLHSHDQCLLAVAGCDLVICLIDKRYGGRYAGGFPRRFKDQTLSVLGMDESGKRRRYDVVVPARDLSITWCELIVAQEKGVPLITFARQRTLDEKETRRHNQSLKAFRPAYAERNEIFDLLDWITKQQKNNWIVSFDTIVDFRKKLTTWVNEMEAAIPKPTGPPDVSKEAQSRICVIVEGEIDRLLVTYLVRKLRLSSYFVVIPSYGKYRILNDFDNVVAQYSPLFREVIVLMDSDAENQRQYETTCRAGKALVEGSRKKHVSIHFAHPNVEAWLAAGLKPDLYRQRQGMIDKEAFNELFFTPSIQNVTNALKSGDFDFRAAMTVCKEFRTFAEKLMSTGLLEQQKKTAIPQAAPPAAPAPGGPSTTLRAAPSFSRGGERRKHRGRSRR